MTKTQKQVKKYIRNRDKGLCQICGKYVWNQGALAHRIANTKTNIKIYGKEIIDHRFNLIWSCFSWTCNDSMNIGGNLGKSQKLVKLIKAYPDKYFDAKFITEKINE